LSTGNRRKRVLVKIIGELKTATAKYPKHANVFFLSRFWRYSRFKFGMDNGDVRTARSVG
jgi:hypothetical protein